MEGLNSLTFERLQYVSEFCNLAVSLENCLTSARTGISRARTLQGVVLSDVFNLDIQTLEPTARIDYNGDKFSLVNNSQSRSVQSEGSEGIRCRKIGESSEQSMTTDLKIGNIQTFRPFGILEPLSAKEARKSMHKALQIVCELASIQREIKKIDAKIVGMKDNLKFEDQINRKLQAILKI